MRIFSYRTRKAVLVVPDDSIDAAALPERLELYDEDGLPIDLGAGGGGAPSGAAGGVLSGTYPNPAFAVDMATQAELDAEGTTRGSADTALDGRLDAVETIFAGGRLTLPGAAQNMGDVGDGSAWSIQGEFPWLVFIPDGDADGSGFELRGHAAYENPLVGFGVLGSEQGVHLYDALGRFLRFAGNAGGAGKPGLIVGSETVNALLYLDSVGVLRIEDDLIVDGDISGPTISALDSRLDTLESAAISTIVSDNVLDDLGEAADFTFDTGSSADLVLGGGGWRAVDNSTDVVVRRTGKTLTRGKIALRLTLGATNYFNTLLRFKYIDANNFWQLQFYNNGNNSWVRDLVKVVGGTPTTVNSQNIASSVLTAGRELWMVVRFAGRYIRYEIWAQDPRTGGVDAGAATLNESPIYHYNHRMSDAEAATFANVAAGYGFRMLSLASPNLPADVTFNDFIAVELGRGAF